MTPIHKLVQKRTFPRINKTMVRYFHTFNRPLEENERCPKLFLLGRITHFLLVEQLQISRPYRCFKAKNTEGNPLYATCARRNIAAAAWRSHNDYAPFVGGVFFNSHSFDTLGVTEFYLNPHYYRSGSPISKHKGETQWDKIANFISIASGDAFVKVTYMMVDAGAHKTLKERVGTWFLEADKNHSESRNNSFTVRRFQFNSTQWF